MQTKAKFKEIATDPLFQEVLLSYLKTHEHQIATGVDGYGALKYPFIRMMGREPCESYQLDNGDLIIFGDETVEIVGESGPFERIPSDSTQKRTGD